MNIKKYKQTYSEFQLKPNKFFVKLFICIVIIRCRSKALFLKQFGLACCGLVLLSTAFEESMMNKEQESINQVKGRKTSWWRKVGQNGSDVILNDEEKNAQQRCKSSFSWIQPRTGKRNFWREFSVKKKAGSVRVCATQSANSIQIKIRIRGKITKITAKTSTRIDKKQDKFASLIIH